MLPKLQLCFWTMWKMQYHLINKCQELNSRKTRCNNAKDLIQNGIMCHHQYMCIIFANFTFTSQVLLKSESAQPRLFLLVKFSFDSFMSYKYGDTELIKLMSALFKLFFHFLKSAFYKWFLFLRVLTPLTCFQTWYKTHANVLVVLCFGFAYIRMKLRFKYILYYEALIARIYVTHIIFNIS